MVSPSCPRSRATLDLSKGLRSPFRAGPLVWVRRGPVFLVYPYYYGTVCGKGGKVLAARRSLRSLS